MSLIYGACGLAVVPVLGYLYWKNLENSSYKKIINTETGQLIAKAPPIIGLNLGAARDKIKEYHEKYGDNVFTYMAGNPLLLTTDPEVIRDILFMKQYKFEKGFLAKIIGNFFGLHNMVLAEGEEWKNQRKIISPAFRNTTIQQLLPIIQKSCEEIMNTISELTKDSSATINITKFITKYTINVITAVAFNNINAEDEILKAFLEGVKINRKIALWNLLPFIRILPDWMKGSSYIEYYKNIFTKWIQKVTEPGEIKKENLSLINLMLSAKDEESANALTDQEIIDNVKMFYFAGHETTATLLSYCLYYLIKYPETFKKIQDEVESAVGDNKEITLEHIEKLTYLQCFIKETLRLKSPVAFINRTPIEDIQVGKYTIPKGIRIAILIDSINRDKNYWDRAEEFIPERWLNIDETKAKSEIHYIPFSMGPRICIGQRLAREEAIVFLVLIAKYFNIKSPKEVVPDPVPDYDNTLFRPSTIDIVFTKRMH